MSLSSLISGPFAHDRSSVERVMRDVCLALVPATLFGFYLFGWPSVYLWIITCASAVGTELLCLKWLGQPRKRIFDSSALLTGWLLALSLPPWAPWWIGVGGSAFAIGIGKQLYGGIGQNPFNPAMLARVALLISFPLQMTTWIVPQPIFSAGAPGPLEAFGIIFGGSAIPDAMVGATALGGLKTDLTLGAGHTADGYMDGHFDLLTALIGKTAGSMGETSEILLLLGGLYLLLRRIIHWDIPVSMLLSTTLMAAIAHQINPDRYPGGLYHLASGGLMMGAFFIATDMVTSPVSRVGRLLFGTGCGVMVYVVRTWGGFPEAVAFAVMFMNALTPLLDRYCRPRAYGRDLRGRPLPTLTVTGRVQKGD